MVKMFKLLENVNNYNSFDEVATFELVNGNQTDLYIRLVQKFATSSPNEETLRYLPSSAATMSIKFDNLDQALVINRVATMVFPLDDRSIWKVTILPNDVINGILKVTLTDGSKVDSILLDGRLKVSTYGNSRFFC